MELKEIRENYCSCEDQHLCATCSMMDDVEEALSSSRQSESEWISVDDENTLLVPPCYALWSDGRQTVLNTQDDCSHAVFNGFFTLTHWRPVLPNPPEANR